MSIFRFKYPRVSLEIEETGESTGVFQFTEDLTND